MANADYENANKALRAKLEKVEKENSQLKSKLKTLEMETEANSSGIKLSEDPFGVGNEIPVDGAML